MADGLYSTGYPGAGAPRWLHGGYSGSSASSSSSSSIDDIVTESELSSTVTDNSGASLFYSSRYDRPPKSQQGPASPRGRSGFDDRHQSSGHTTGKPSVRTTHFASGTTPQFRALSPTRSGSAPPRSPHNQYSSTMDTNTQQPMQFQGTGQRRTSSGSRHASPTTKSSRQAPPPPPGSPHRHPSPMSWQQQPQHAAWDSSMGPPYEPPIHNYVNPAAHPPPQQGPSTPRAGHAERTASPPGRRHSGRHHYEFSHPAPQQPAAGQYSQTHVNHVIPPPPMPPEDMLPPEPPNRTITPTTTATDITHRETPELPMRSTPVEHLVLERDALHTKLNSLSAMHQAELERKEQESKKVIGYWKHKFVQEKAERETLLHQLQSVESSNADQKEVESRRTEQLCMVMKEKKTLLKNIDDLQQGARTKDAELSCLTDKLQEAEARNEELAAKLNGMMTTSQEVEDRDSVRRDQIRLLEQQLQTLRTDLEQQNKTVLRLKEDKERVEEQLATWKTSTDEVGALQKQNAALKTNLSKLKAEIQTVQVDKSVATKEMSATLASMMDNISCLNQDIASKQAEVTHHRTESIKLADQLEECIQQNQEIRLQLNKERSARSEMEVMFERTSAELRMQLQAQQKERTDVEMQLSTAQSALQQHTTATVDMNSQLESTTQENQLLKEKANQQAHLLNERAQLSHLISQMDTKFTSAVEEIKAAQIYTFGNDIKQMEARLQDLTELQQQLRWKDKELEKAKEELVRLETHINAVSKMFVKFPMSIDELEWMILELEELKKVAGGPEVEARVKARKAALYNLSNASPTGTGTAPLLGHSPSRSEGLATSPTSASSSVAPSLQPPAPSLQVTPNPPLHPLLAAAQQHQQQQQAQLPNTSDISGFDTSSSNNNLSSPPRTSAPGLGLPPLFNHPALGGVGHVSPPDLAAAMQWYENAIQQQAKLETAALLAGLPKVPPTAASNSNVNTSAPPPVPPKTTHEDVDGASLPSADGVEIQDILHSV